MVLKGYWWSLGFFLYRYVHSSFQVEVSQSLIRIVGLSATLPNYVDVAAFLRVNPNRGLFFFDARFLPVPLGMSFVGVKQQPGVQSRFAQEAVMNEACYERVLEQLKKDEQASVNFILATVY